MENDEAAPRPASLWRLPPEIRSQIYQMALCAPELRELPDALNFEKMFGRQEDEGRSSAPSFRRSTALLRASRQVSLEAAAVLYGRTEFVFTATMYESCVVDDFEPNVPRGLMNLVPFLRAIGARNRRLLRRVTVEFGAAPCSRFLRMDLFDAESDITPVFWDSLELLAEAKAFLTLRLDFSDVIDWFFGIFVKVWDSIGGGSSIVGGGGGSARLQKPHSPRDKQPMDWYVDKFSALKGIRDLQIVMPNEYDCFLEEDRAACAAASLVSWAKEGNRAAPYVPETLEAGSRKRIVDIQDKLERKSKLEEERARLLRQLRENLVQMDKTDSEIAHLL